LHQLVTVRRAIGEAAEQCEADVATTSASRTASVRRAAVAAEAELSAVTTTATISLVGMFL